jgi:cell fate (sporulation/competence/biofilm development) regulator YlbF (YheA/YmcA/DUF963 family)
MVNPYDRAYELARSIRESDAYRQLKEAKTQLDENPKFREMLESWSAKRQEFLSLELQGKEPSSEQKEEMNKLMTAIQGVPAIVRFLEAESRFSVLMTDLQRIIMEPMEEIFGKLGNQGGIKG